MRAKFINKIIKYDGSQLKSHWVYQNFGILGDVIIAFIGSSEVKEHLVDLIDKKKGQFIYSPKMLHFIVEHFGCSLKEIILRQNILANNIAEEINSLYGKIIIKRKGTDLYYKDKKISVSVATISLVSGLIHFGLNILVDKNVPVKAGSLTDLNIQPEKLAEKVLKKYILDYKNFKKNLIKVKSVE